MNIARWFSSYRLLETALEREQSEVTRLRSELQEWQDKVLTIKGMSPIYQPRPQTPVEPPPPIGITAKRERVAAMPGNGIKTAEEILEAANAAKAR